MPKSEAAQSLRFREAFCVRVCAVASISACVFPAFSPYPASRKAIGEQRTMVTFQLASSDYSFALLATGQRRGRLWTLQTGRVFKENIANFWAPFVQILRGERAAGLALVLDYDSVLAEFCTLGPLACVFWCWLAGKRGSTVCFGNEPPRTNGLLARWLLGSLALRCRILTVEAISCCCFAAALLLPDCLVTRQVRLCLQLAAGPAAAI
ncbi:hypothetical protein BD289DRAFT_65980 [Coniella lustricola]|uniref:Uncharacterized protein n=1 Tax=Coniella lustricola TaxID=2025994 RepID=A0A2T3AHX3_9PEZI|nr:hypothetical protein BD289DRAFT_65980 [Coniella lustricola]